MPCGTASTPVVMPASRSPPSTDALAGARPLVSEISATRRLWSRIRGGQSIRVARRLERTQQPVRPPRAVGRDARGRPRDLEPTAVDVVRAVDVDRYVAVRVLGARPGHPDRL